MTTRPALRWATYAGDRRSMVGQVVGPTTLNDFATAVDAEYDATADRTRVGFAFLSGVEPGEAAGFVVEVDVGDLVGQC